MAKKYKPATPSENLVRWVVVAFCGLFLLVEHFMNNNYDAERRMYKENKVKHAVYSICRRIIIVTLVVNLLLIATDYIHTYQDA